MNPSSRRISCATTFTFFVVTAAGGLGCAAEAADELTGSDLVELRCNKRHPCDAGSAPDAPSPADAGSAPSDLGTSVDAAAPGAPSAPSAPSDSGTTMDAGAPSAPSAPTTPTTPTTPSDCLSRASVSKISGAHTSGYRDSPVNGGTVDARGASWLLNDGWLATPGASADVCWLGGELSLALDDSSMSPTAAWANVWHHDGGFTLKYANTNWIFDGVTVRHVGDAFNLSDGAQSFVIRNSHISDVRDDCVQNDDMHAGNVHDNFFDGCYVGFSARASAGTTPNDGHLNAWVIDKNLIWIKPMYSVYKGDSPGNGQLIKWEKTAPEYAPHLVFTNNIVRVGKLPFQTGSSGDAFYFPPDMTFSNNTLVWDGAGPVPASLTAWFNAAHGSRVLDLSAWNDAVAAWRAAHPDVK